MLARARACAAQGKGWKRRRTSVGARGSGSYRCDGRQMRLMGYACMMVVVCVMSGVCVERERERERETARVGESEREREGGRERARKTVCVREM